MAKNSTIKYVIISIVVLFLVVVLYLKFSFQKPEISSFENIELQSLSDSSCKILLTLRIKNDNFFSIKAKNIGLQLSSNVQGEMTDAEFTLPSKSEENYEFALSLHFNKIENLIHLSDSNSGNSPIIQLQAKPSFWPSYMSVSEKMNSGLKGNLATQLFAQIIKQNLSLKKIQWPKDPSLSSIKIQFDLEFNNPYDVAITMNRYDIKIFEDSSKHDLMGTLQNDSSFTIAPHTVHSFANSLTISPMNSLLNSAMKLWQGNLEYYFLLSGNISIGNYQSDISTGFSFNPLNSSQ